jgi:hypothetical protein
MSALHDRVERGRALNRQLVSVEAENPLRRAEPDARFIIAQPIAPKPPTVRTQA